MDFYVNKEKIDITLENEKTVGDVLKSFEEECARNNATTINIVLNGNNVNAEDFEKASATELSDNTKLELTIVTCDEVKKAFENQKSACSAISEELKLLPVKLQGGKDKEATEMIAKLADLIENFCHTATLSALFPDLYEKLKVDGKTVSEFFQDFSGILNDFEQAISSKDTVLMGDLAEYEISPRLESIAKTIEEL
jgi:hypothetical protein